MVSIGSRVLDVEHRLEGTVFTITRNGVYVEYDSKAQGEIFVSYALFEKFGTAPARWNWISMELADIQAATIHNLERQYASTLKRLGAAEHALKHIGWYSRSYITGHHKSTEVELRRVLTDISQVETNYNGLSEPTVYQRASYQDAHKNIEPPCCDTSADTSTTHTESE